jgi:hypothetical protein
MMASESNLLAEVQRDALNAQAPLADTLRKLVALGGEVGSTELREWAGLELRGYLGVEVPEYRKPGAILQVDAIVGNMQITGQQISARELPESAQKLGEAVQLPHPVAEIEAMLDRASTDSGSIKLTIPMAQEVALLWNHESEDAFQHVNSIYFSVSAPALSGVLDRVRTTLVELVAEMRAGMPASAEAPSREVADHAVNVVVHGEGHSVNVTTAAASGSGTHQVEAQSAMSEAPQVEVAWPELRGELSELGVPGEELEKLHKALLTDGDPTDRELGTAASGWIGQLSTRVASGAITLAGATSTEVVTHTILKALNLA